MNDAQQLFEDWVPIRQKVIEQSAIQLNNNANEVTRTEGAPHIAKIMRSLDGLIRFANSKAKEFTQTAQTSGSKANAAILVGKFYRHPFAVSTTAMEIQAAVYGILINMKDLSVAPSAEKVNIIRNEIDGKVFGRQTGNRCCRKIDHRLETNPRQSNQNAPGTGHSKSWRNYP